MKKDLLPTAMRVYLTDGVTPPVEVQPPPRPRKYWTRRGLAEWLVERLRDTISGQIERAVFRNNART